MDEGWTIRPPSPVLEEQPTADIFEPVPPDQGNVKVTDISQMSTYLDYSETHLHTHACTHARTHARMHMQAYTHCNTNVLCLRGWRAPVTRTSNSQFESCD